MSPKHSGRGTGHTDSQQTHPRWHTHTHMHTPHTLPRYTETQGTRTQPRTNISGQTQTYTQQSHRAHTRTLKHTEIYPEHTKNTHAEAHVYVDAIAEDSKHPGTCCIDMDTSNAQAFRTRDTHVQTLCTRTHTQPQSVCGPSSA